MGGLERLGESGQGPGYLLLGLLSQAGWSVDIVAAAGCYDEVVVSVSQLGRRTVSRQGRTVGEVAPGLVEEVLAGR